MTPCSYMKVETETDRQHFPLKINSIIAIYRFVLGTEYVLCKFFLRILPSFYLATPLRNSMHKHVHFCKYQILVRQGRCNDRRNERIITFMAYFAQLFRSLAVDIYTHVPRAQGSLRYFCYCYGRNHEINEKLKLQVVFLRHFRALVFAPNP